MIFANKKPFYPLVFLRKSNSSYRRLKLPIRVRISKLNYENILDSDVLRICVDSCLRFGT